MRHDRITALWFIERPINSEAFLLYTEKFWSRPRGMVVIMDNLD
jgi:hypothetical protein